MKLERLHESLLPFFVILIGLLVAVGIGTFAGSGQTGSVLPVIGAIGVVAFFLIVREKIWILIPSTWMLSGKIVALPLPFSLAQLCVLFAFGTFLLLKAFKVIRIKPKMGLVEIWMMIVLGYLVVTFIRNPVGVDAFGSDRVGGKPYADAVIACCAYWVLARAVATPKESQLVLLLGVAGYGLNAWVNAIAYRFPSTAQPMARLYSGISAADTAEGSTVLASDGSARLAYLQGIGGTLFSYAYYRWPPFTVINPIYIGRFLTVLIAFILVLMSGFRSALMSTFLAFLMVTYLRNGLFPALRAVVAAALGLGFVVLGQGTLYELPFAAQRTLSFLPGKWDYMAKKEAEASTEWRTTMWKVMLTGNKYIQNKWLGDGYGFTKVQLQIMSANQWGSDEDLKENLMIGGGVHSGPISSIRYVGYVGLTLFLILLLLAARRALQLIRRAENTPFYTLALAAGIPLILYPFLFVVVFGAYETDLPNAIFAIGMQKLLENSLEAYEARGKSPITKPQTVEAPKFRRPPEFVQV